ncbi:conjugal transfer protein TraC [Rhizobium mesoamericanum]|uniref:Conjugal transfer protein traC n=1 Tax=Rhizobium mesoamericanum STM3625 TaxID=1211777 RepID=K0Q4I1_9HYPH|nr:conjugal transfer protein TraC [Rhizobium mesoamericanum]CCM79452.1 Conjugal transfer protein traC [Rhizobium mesoamericanum STM3625]
MKKSASRIREDIAKLQDQLKQAETKDAERIGRIALKAGLGEIEVEEADLHAALADLAGRFRKGKALSNGMERAGPGSTSTTEMAPVTSGAAESSAGEA